MRSQLNRHTIGGVAACALATLLLAACGSGGSGSSGEVTLRVADHFPETNPHASGGSMAFIDELEKTAATYDASVEVNYLGGEQLAGASELFDAVRDGTADIAAVVLSYVTSEIPEAEVGQLPGAFSSAAQGSQAYWNLVDGQLQDKFIDKGVRPIFAACLPPYQIVTADKKVTDLDVVKGMSLRSSGGAMSLTVEAIGGIPVETPAPDTYLALQRGTVKGSLLPFSSIPSYKLEEVSKFATENLSLGSACTVWLINEDVWQGLSEEVQKAIREAGVKIAASVGGVFDTANTSAADVMSAAGVEIYDVDPQTLEDIDTRTSAVTENWAKEIDKRGAEGTKTLSTWRDLLKQ